ncbi:MAG: cytochrome C oxidase subunit II [Ignavibacteria bacterium]
MPEPSIARVAARAEMKWAVAAGAVIVFLIAMIAYMSLHWATMPPMRLETVDPTTLHLAGEFTEENLGSAVESDGSVTVRLVAAQYSFSPPCLLVPTDTPITFRATSADVIHGFNIARTNVNVMLEPGYVSIFKATFREPGDHVMPCHEFCGVGHAGMWARVKVVDKNDFLRQAAGARRLSCAQ